MIQLRKHRELNNNQFEDVLIYFSKSILGQQNEDDILWDLAKNCISKLDFVDCVIYLLDSEKQALIQKAAYGPKNPKDNNLYKPVKINIGEGITGSVAITGKAEIVNNTVEDFRYIVDDEMRLSEICVPIIHEDVIYGVIDCENPEKDFFTNQHLKMLSAIASICAIKIKSVRANMALLEKQNKLLKVKEELVELKLKALNSQMNPHFVFNALNAIQFLITSNSKKLALEYLSTFSKLIRFYLKHLNQDFVFLKDEINMLNRYLKLQKFRYENQFNYNISIKQDSIKQTVKIPSFIIQTLLENIIEHGAYSQHKNQKINVLFNVSNAKVETTIISTHDPINFNKVNYTPEYRTNIFKWQDQIDLLNTLKKYNIEKCVSFIKDDNHLCGSEITLKLPNLK